MRLGLVLLPEPSVSEACIATSRALVAARSARVVLDATRALAHVSILHVELDRCDPAAAWAETEASLPREAELSGMSLALLPYTAPYNAPHDPRTATMAYLIVPCTAALRAMEERALGLEWVRAGRVTTGNGDRFQPHVTLAIWDGAVWPARDDLAAPLARRGPFRARLALGVIGENGVYRETLHGG